MTLSPHFTVTEVTRSATAAAQGIDNTIPLAYRYYVGRVAEFMECVRVLLDNGPINVTSWFRSQSLNTAIGGSKTSVHMKALALDWQHGILDLEEAFEVVARSQLPFDQLIIEGTADGAQWIHSGLSEKAPRRQVLRSQGDELGGPMVYTRVAMG